METKTGLVTGDQGQSSRWKGAKKAPLAFYKSSCKLQIFPRLYPRQ